MEKKKKTVFVEGAISSEFIGTSIGKHQSKTSIGAHAIFLGQVREDEIEGKSVAGIEYTAYQEMAETALHELREETFAKYDLTCMHIYHSLGLVKTGEICLFVFVSSPHRKASFEASEYLVNELKAKAPIFGKEVFSDQKHRWKENN
jgi:molybdopterin synthase catalytic subunit